MKLFKSLKTQATGFLDQYKQKDPASYAAAQQAVGGLLIVDGLIGIDNPFSSNKRPGIFGTLMGIAGGIVFMLVPTFFGNITGMNNLTSQTNGQVVSVGAPQVSRDSDGTSTTACVFTAMYKVDGKEYRSSSSMSASNYCQLAVGQSIAIDYNPKNPAQWGADTKTTLMLLSIFFYVGIVVLLTSIVTFGIRLLSIIFGWKILRSGRKLASSIPGGADLGAMINSIKQEFSRIVFGSGNIASIGQAMQGAPVAAPVPVAQPPVAQNPITPVPQSPVQSPESQQSLQPPQPQQPQPQQPPVLMPPSNDDWGK